MEHSKLEIKETLTPVSLPKAYSCSALHSGCKQPRASRDEMNLAEFPLTVLSTRCDPSLKTLEFKDTVKGKNGNLITRQWVITGADKFGLPTSSDDEVLLGLMKLTVDDGFRQRKIFFTRYELLRSLSWTTEGRSYTRLQNALDRLSGVRIKATNAFYDNESKSHSTKNFGIIDAYEINDGRDPSRRASFFIWSEEIFRSFQVGFIKKLDLDYYLSLKSAISKRLYRYLDKHFWYKSRLAISLFTLAHEKLGVSRNYRYASSLRQQLDPAVEELVEKGFLSKCEYVGRGKGTEIVLYAALKTPRVLAGNSAAKSESVDTEPDFSANLSTATRVEEEAVNGESEEVGPSSLVQMLVVRGLKERQATKLLSCKTEEALLKIKCILVYYDDLLASGSNLVSKSPVGFLYWAVANHASFILPAQYDLEAGREVGRPDRGSNALAAERGQRDLLQESFQQERRSALRQLRQGVERELLEGLREEVAAGLAKFKGKISDKRFQETVEHGVDDRLAQLFALPDFAEWQAEKQGKRGAEVVH